MRAAAASRGNLGGLDGDNVDKEADAKTGDDAGIAYLGDVFRYGLVHIYISHLIRYYLVEARGLTAR